MVGRTISHYQILEKIGEGGMGVVYKARDTHLNRSVALKVLPPEKVADPERKRRFVQEAQSASALNHPNIIHIYDIDQQDGVDYIAMEHVQGKTLGELIGRKGLKLGDALKYGVQIADALSRAHAAGIMHRDLKPGNVMVDEHGLVKVLDFGLAKLTETVTLGEDESTRTVRPTTEEGTIVGTVAYMSPEQAEGKRLDTRSDIFSFGSVLYEMVTGRRAFQGDTRASTLAAVLKEEPKSASQITADLPKEVDRVIRRCLRKDPANRMQTMADLKVALEELKEESASGELHGVTKPETKRPWRWRWAAAVAVVALMLAIALIWQWRERTPPRIESLAVLPVKDLSEGPTKEYFADGMTDALIASLAQIKAVKVISLTSVMQYKDKKKSLPQIAGELGVNGIVEATVMRSEGQVRVTARLIEARHERILWSNKYEREMTEVLALQSELVQAIAGEIRVQVTPQESERLKTARRVDPEVYDATLKGKRTLEYATSEGELHQAIELFQKAIDRDPTYAPAWAGFGEALWDLAATGWEFVAPADVRDKAIKAADKALELDGALPDAYKARAVIAIDGEWDLAKAQWHFERALELRPGYAAAHNVYGQILAVPLLRFDEARQHYDRARELDPLSPWNDINLVGWWTYQGRPGRAFEEGERAHRRNPTLYSIPWEMGSAQLLLGQPSQAVPQFEAALELLRSERPAGVLASLGLAYGLARRRVDALKILAEMEQASQKRYISPFYFAMVYSGLDRMDEAFRLLDRALDQRTPWLVTCTPWDPLSVALRRDPRWKPFIYRLRQLVKLPPDTPNPY